MSVFKDFNGDEWRVMLDAFVIADAKKETGIDLADLSAGGWLAVATDASAVGRVLAVVCGDEIRARKMNGRSFSRLIRGEAIEAGRAALLSEGADFFPPNEWSAIRSNLTKRTAATRQSEAAKILVESPQTMQIMDAFLKLPKDIQLKLIEAKGEADEIEDTDSPTSPGSGSVGGPVDMPLTLPTDLLVSADLTAVG
jgi:hypothetical protein